MVINIFSSIQRRVALFIQVAEHWNVIFEEAYRKSDNEEYRKELTNEFVQSLQVRHGS